MTFRDQFTSLSYSLLNVTMFFMLWQHIWYDTVSVSSPLDMALSATFTDIYSRCVLNQEIYFDDYNVCVIPTCR